MRIFTVLLFAVAAAALALAGCIAPPPAAPASGDAPPATTAANAAAPAAATEGNGLAPLKIISLPYITFAPFYIAEAEGYFADQGLSVEMVDIRRSEEMMPALSSGQVDVAAGLVSAGLLNAIARGGGIKITADKGVVDPQGCVNWAVMGRADLVASGELDEPADMAGRTIEVSPANWLEFYLSEVLATGGLTLDDIQKVRINTPSLPEALEQGAVDLVANSEPWITIFSDAGHQPVFALPQVLLPDASAAAVIYGPNLLDENREVGVRFMAAYLQGVRQYAEGKTERNLEIVADATQLDPALLEKMCWPAIRLSGELNVESVLQFQDWAIAQGYQDAPVTPAQFYDGSFVAEANEILGSTE